MSTTTSDLLNRANIIKNETLEGKNSAVRVGSLFWDIISKMEGNTSKLSTLEELINSGSSKYSNVRVTPVYTNGVLIATIRVGVQDYAIYAPGKGDSGSDSDSDGYDDSEIRREIDLIKSNLDNILEREKAGIKDMVEEILAGKNFINGWQEGWSEILKSYLISVGVLGADGESKGWAYLDIKYRGIEAAVNNLTALSEDNKGLYETLQARLNIFIDDEFGELKRSVTELSNRYALTTKEQKVIQWFTAQLYMEALNGRSLAQLYASAGDLASTQEAIANLEVKVENIEGRMVSKASLTTQVSNALGQLYTSGLISRSTLGSALATIFAEGTDSSLNTIKSKIDVWVNEGIAGITADTQLLELIADKLITHTNLLQLVADNVEIDATNVIASMESLKVKVKELMLGSELDGADFHDGKYWYDNSMYIHTIKNNSNDVLGMEFLFGNFTISSDGDVNKIPVDGASEGTYKALLRCRFGYYYLDAPKIVTSHVLFPDQNADNSKPAYIDLSKATTIRWYEHVGADHSSGDEIGYKNTEGDNLSNGTITFSGDTITINGKLHVTGGVV